MAQRLAGMGNFRMRTHDNLTPQQIVDLLHTLRPADEWTEEDGDVLWWHLPLQEYPIVGSHAGMGTSDRYGEPTDCRRLQEEGWLTHWTPLPFCGMLVATDGTKVEPE